MQIRTRLLQFEIGWQVQLVDIDRLGVHIERGGPVGASHDDCNRPQAPGNKLPAARSVDSKLPGFDNRDLNPSIGKYRCRAQAGHVLPGCPHEHDASPDRRREKQAEREDHELQWNHPDCSAAVRFECRINEIGHNRNPDVANARKHS